MAKSTGSGKKKLDLSTANTADGQLQAARSVYEIVGIKENPYRIHDFIKYSEFVRGMNLDEMQEHAHAVRVLPVAKRDILIERLETKFRSVHGEERVARTSNSPNPATVSQSERDTIKQAQDFLSRYK